MDSLSGPSKKIGAGLRKSRKFVIFGSVFISFLMFCMMLLTPGNVSYVSASFTEPTYGDTIIAQITLVPEGAPSDIVDWKYLENPNEIFVISEEYNINTITIGAIFNSSRMDVVTTIEACINITFIIISPSGVSTTYYSENANYSVCQGTTSGTYICSWYLYDDPYEIDEIGVYQVSVIYMIDIP